MISTCSSCVLIVDWRSFVFSVLHMRAPVDNPVEFVPIDLDVLVSRQNKYPINKDFKVNRQVKLNQNLHHYRDIFADRQTEHNLSYCPSHRSSIRLHLQFAWLNSMLVSSSLSFLSHPFSTETFVNFQCFFRSDLLLRFFHVQITIEVMTCSEKTIRLYRHLKAPQIPFSAFKLTNPNSERAPFIRTPCFKSNREDTLLYF